MNNNNHMQNVINKIITKLNNINDPELKMLFFELIEERNELYSEIHIDELSKLYNRKVINLINSTSGVVMIDIDNFKLINDNFGHHTGDYVIREISKVVLNNIRSCDIGVRYGGDEILISFNNCSEEIIEARIKKIKDEVKKNVKLPNCIITLSIGVAINEDNENINFLIHKADKAMYESKKNGKDLITKYKNETLKKHL